MEGFAGFEEGGKDRCEVCVVVLVGIEPARDHSFSKGVGESSSF